MTTNVRTATNAFINIFPKRETDKKQSDQFRTESDDAVIFNNLRFAEKLFPNNGLMLCPVSHSGSKYVSESCVPIFGHGYETLMKMDIPDFFAIVHADDLPFVKLCLEFIRSCEPYDPETHRFTIYFRVKNSDGKYVHIRNENIAVKTEHNSYLYLMLFSNVSNDEKFFQVRLEVSKNIKGVFSNVYTYNPKQPDKVITPRQNDIVRLILKGFTNQEIADQLSVSIYTVKNHKQMLFKKVNVKNSIELANYVRRSSL